jgi:hypothetical protein
LAIIVRQKLPIEHKIPIVLFTPSSPAECSFDFVGAVSTMDDAIFELISKFQTEVIPSVLRLDTLLTEINSDLSGYLITLVDRAGMIDIDALMKVCANPTDQSAETSFQVRIEGYVGHKH